MTGMGVAIANRSHMHEHTTPAIDDRHPAEYTTNRSLTAFYVFRCHADVGKIITQTTSQVIAINDRMLMCIFFVL